MKLKFYKLYSLLVLLFLLSNSLFIKPDRDILFYDETNYLEGGNQKFAFVDSAVYRLHYKILSKFIKDPIDRYFINFQLLVFLFGVCFLFVARSKKELILIVSFLILLFSSRFLSDLWPFITLLSSIWLVLLYISFRANHDFLSIIFCFLLVFTRVEFLCLYYLLFFLILYKSWGVKRKKGSLFLKFFLYLFGFIIILTHNPSDGERSYIAFCQHYAFSKFVRNVYMEDPWTTCGLLLTKDFGDAKNLLDLWMLNPKHFGFHLFYNLDLFLKKIQELFLIPPVVGIVFIFSFLFFEIKGFIQICFLRKKRKIANHLLLYVLLGISFVTILVIFPREHYILHFLVSIVLLSIQQKNFHKIFRTLKSNPIWLYFVVPIVVVILLTFYFQKAKTIRSVALRNPCSNIFTLQVLRNLELKTYNILAFDGSVCAYLPNANCKQFQISDKNVSFDQFLEQNRINVLILSDHWDRDQKYIKDSEYHFFISHSYKTKTTGDLFELNQFSLCPNRKILLKK
ncbi:hypothetical protein EHQ47_19365 [Leptospira bourretii]|uniref:hypothetical protein n=1 Tax=Leptospira bourretii TaxID=2484962 RepID=UPI001090F506|nr:hypothetical protein [Leptospira bourretii]TGL17887.1 hypothetical protein EHQ47_19365 [Leptospira bourretii]